MSTTLVEVRNPALDHIIERPRLIKLIEEADARIVLLCAPAGYGKTTLAKQWCARQSGPVAWYRTTRTSGDVGALAIGLDKVLANAVSPANRDPTRIESIASATPKPAPLARALTAMHGSLEGEVLLVLDEWEAAGTEESDELISRLIEDTGMRLLITSRIRPPWFTARLQLYGAGLEVRAEQLALTDSEAVAVLARQPDAPETRSFLAMADGWPAIVGLAAVTKTATLDGHNHASRTLYDYFANELLGAVDAEVRDAVTLVALSAISRITTAELVLGAKARSVLAKASERGVLTVDHEDHITIHPLLRELLVEGVRRAGATERASLADKLLPLIRAQQWEEALAAAEVIEDPGFINSALEIALEDLVRQQRVATIERWIRAARAARVDSALVDYAESEVALRRAEFDRALTLAAYASAHLPDEWAAAAHIVAARAAHLGTQGEMCELHVEAALALAANPSTVASAHWLRVVRALDTEQADIADLLARFEHANDGSPDHLIRVEHGRLNLGHVEGDLLRRVRNGRSALHLLTSNIDPMVRSAYLNGLSSTMGDCGLFDESLAVAELEAELAEEYDLEFVMNFALTNRARAFIGMRRFALAKRSLSTLLRRAKAAGDAYSFSQHKNLLAALFLSMSDQARAYAVLALDPDPTDGRVVAGEHLATRALARAAQGNTDIEVDTMQACALSRSLAVRATTQLALTLLALEGRDEARASQLVDEAIRTEVAFPLVLALRSSSPLVAFLREQEQHRPLLADLLMRSRDAAIAKRMSLNVPRSEVRSQALTPRELEIHGLIAQGMTNAEIARLLFISPSTTKVHVRHILEKLGVRYRAEAARIWQEES